MAGSASTPSIPKGKPLRIVMIGPTGVGKSTVGNAILGRKAFPSWPSPNSATKTCRREAMLTPRKIEMIDTPGIIDSSRDPDYIKNEIVKSIRFSSPGPHAFLLVMKMGTTEEQNAVKILKELFGGKAAAYMFVLFTHAEVPKPYEVVRNNYTKLIANFGNRFHVLNKTGNEQTQVAKLVEKIDLMVKANGGGHFTDEMAL